MKNYIIICAYILCTAAVFAQDTWLNYTNTFTITDIEEVEDGRWFASQGGLFFVDNRSEEEVYYHRGNSDIPSNGVNDLLMHPQGGLWMTTTEGISRFEDGVFSNGPKKLTGVLRLTADEKIIVANLDSLYIQVDGMEFESVAYPNYVASIGGIEVADDGTIYVNAINFFAETYVAAYNDEIWDMLYSAFIYNSAFRMDRDDQLWLFNLEGLHLWQEGTWSEVVQAENISGGMYSILGLHVDRSGHMILHIEQQGCPVVLRWDGSILTELDFVQGVCEDVSFIKPSSDEMNTYFATNRKQGFYPFSSSDITDYQPYAQSPLYANSVLTTLHPTDGSHLVIHANHIQSIVNDEWLEIPLPQGLDDHIRFAHLRADVPYLCDRHSIWFYAEDTWEAFDLPAGFSGEIEFLVTGENGDLWVQEGTRIYRHADDTWQVFTSADHQIMNSSIQDMKVDPRTGDLWVSSFQGVRRYDGSTWEVYNFSPVNHTFDLAISEEGVYVYQGGDLRFIQQGSINAMSGPPEGAFGGFLSEMIYDQTHNRLYTSAPGRLAIRENEEWVVYSLDNSNIYNGITNDLSLDPSGHLWMSGRQGGLMKFFLDSTLVSVEEVLASDHEDTIEVYPTLVRDGLLHVRSTQEGLHKISMYDINGELLKVDSVVCIPSAPVVYQLPNSPAGMYFLRVSNEHGYYVKRIINVASTR